MFLTQSRTCSGCEITGMFDKGTKAIWYKPMALEYIENIAWKEKIVTNNFLLYQKCDSGFFPPDINDTFPKQQILDSSKLKEFADNNFEFDENGEKFSKRVENTVRKGEIAHSEQFLFFPQCFQDLYC